MKIQSPRCGVVLAALAVSLIAGAGSSTAADLRGLQSAAPLPANIYRLGADTLRTLPVGIIIVNKPLPGKPQYSLLLLREGGTVPEGALLFPLKEPFAFQPDRSFHQADGLGNRIVILPSGAIRLFNMANGLLGEFQDPMLPSIYKNLFALTM